MTAGASTLGALVGAFLIGGLPTPLTAQTGTAAGAGASFEDHARARVVHLLQRATYGPRPEDIAAALATGSEAWLDSQLKPDEIDDSALAIRLEPLDAATLSLAELYEAYPNPRRTRAAVGDVDSLERRRQLREMRQAGFESPRRIGAELGAARLQRAVYSERQLEAVMTDFWFNRFNVYWGKGMNRWLVPDYEREAIRPHVFGRFEDLLLATARHPAMLFYLDNWLSTRDDLVVPGRGRRGLNENYARELMELHTLGVDGGYSQQDVVEVARCFTGWTIDRPQQGGGFLFRPAAHDRRAKQVLGTVIMAGGGQDDGLAVINLLTRHPSTARFIATKLARRFVTDDPPPALVDRAARTFRETDGDIRAVLVTIFTSPEFLSADTYRAKTKTPLEVVASAVRVLDGQVDPSPAGNGAVRASAAGGALTLARQVAALGAPLYESAPPTGYADVAAAWVNTGALLARMNFALALSQGRLSGVRVDLARPLGDVDRGKPAAVLDRVIAALLHGEASARTRQVLGAHLDSPEIVRATADDRGPRNTDVEKLAALVLGSPEFQRR